MSWFIGIDGGGTKTSFAIGKKDGKPVDTFTSSGCSYNEIGIDAVCQLLYNGISELLKNVNASFADCDGCCIGLPCYGENSKMDKIIEQKLVEMLSPMPIKIVNDGVVGWAGSLECKEGIHLVAGTGAIAFGRDKNKVIERAGGWHEFFDDCGSCYWIGREAMTLFAKQADGRVEKGPLYEIVKKELNLNEDFEFIDNVIEISKYRDKVAKFQVYAFEAGKLGDKSVIELYSRAADELALHVKAIKDKLSWSTDIVNVSYFGGLFNVKDLILSPLSKRLTELNCLLKPPLHTATEGALLLSINEFFKEDTYKCI